MTDVVWRLPEAADVLEVALADGASVFVRRHGNPSGPRVLLSHGCGLAIDTYYPYWSRLEDRFDLFVYDLRSHGWNPPGSLRSQNIPTFVRDCEAVLRAIGQTYGEEPVVGAFHSLSGLVALLHEEQWKGFAGLMLFDVPIMPPGGRPEDLVEMGEEMSLAARRRQGPIHPARRIFPAASLAVPFTSRLLPPVIDLMAKTTLRRSPDGTEYELCCPREHEAQVYEYLFGWAMRVDLKKVSCPGPGCRSRPDCAILVHAQHGPHRAGGPGLRLPPRCHPLHAVGKSRSGAGNTRWSSCAAWTWPESPLDVI